MTRLAITGHRGLPTQTVTLVQQGLREVLEPLARDLVGMSCLADGADQIFARLVLELGGELKVLVPAEKYREDLPEESHPTYDELYAHANHIQRLPYTESTSEAHMAASQTMVDQADLLVAVWDGQPARGYGGTADIVSYAHQTGTPATVVWPEGASRD